VAFITNVGQGEDLEAIAQKAQQTGAEWELRSREALMAYATQYGIPVPTTPAKPYSMDRNLLHTSYEGSILEDSWQEPPAEIFLMSVAPEQAPQPSYLSRYRLCSRHSDTH
jgi:argininosuccinate synthase